MMTPLITEADAVSQELLDIILLNIIEPYKVSIWSVSPTVAGDWSSGHEDPKIKNKHKWKEHEISNKLHINIKNSAPKKPIDL